MGKELTLKRSSKDYYGRQNITITIDNVSIEVPLATVIDFFTTEDVLETCVPIPD